MEREVLISSPYHLVIEDVGMVQSCTMGGLDWTLGSISSPSTNTGTRNKAS